MRNPRLLVFVLSLLLLRPDSLWAETGIVKRTFQDGAYLAASPLRLTKEDLPWAGGAIVLIGGGFALDRLTRRNLRSDQNDRGVKNLQTYGDVAQYSGLIFGAGFALHSVMTNNSYSKETAWLAIEGLGWATAISGIAKYVIGRKRPSQTDEPFQMKVFSSNLSFPSGHTTAAFAAAEVFAEQYPTWKVAIPVYVAATAVGASRLYANQHWASDVIAGALLGTAVSHTLRKRHLRPDKGWEFTAGPEGIQLSRKF